MAVSPLSLSLSLVIVQTLLLLTSSSAKSPPFNLSHFISPVSTEVKFPPQPPPFLQDILRVVSLWQGWNKSDEVRVSKLDVANVRFSGSPRYEFHVQVGDTKLAFKMNGDVSKWKKMVVEKGRGFESLIKEIGLVAVIDNFFLKGPLELLAKGDNELALHLPRNTSLAGLTRILVGEDITLEVRNAEEVSALFALELGKNRSRGQKKGSQIWPFERSLCEPLLPVHISGSAIVAAYRNRNPSSYIKTKFLSGDTVELLPEKCYTGKNYKKRQYRKESLTLRIAVMEKLLKIILGSKIYDDETFGFIRVNTRASAAVRFKIELERNMRKEDNLQGRMGEWRTRPSVEHVWFNVVARIEGDRLKPLKIKKIRPSIEVDSASLSNIMSNMSFTKFPSFLVPPEDLTLDVKW